MVKISSKKIATTLANACIQRPYLIIIICLFFCIVAGSGAQHLQFSNSYRLFFSDENPELNQYDNFLDTYNKSDLALIVLHNPKGHIIDKEYVSTIEWLTNESWQLPFITRVDSISNFQYSYSVDDDLMVEDLLFNANQASNQHLYERTNIALAEPVLSGNIISSNGDTTAIVLTAHLPEKSLDEPTRLATAVRELADNVREKHPELKIALSGVVMLNNAFSEASLNDMQSLIPLMYLILIITTILVLRSAYAAVTAVLVVCLSVIFAMGISGYINIPLSPVAIAAPTIIMTLAIADSIHVLVSMLSDYRENGDKEKAIRESIRVNFSPICITSITTIIGFLTLNFSDAPPYWHLGNITAFGILAAWALSLSFLPALLTILPIKRPKQRISEHSVMQQLASFVFKRRIIIVLIGFLSSTGLAISALQLELNDEFVKYFSSNIQFRQDADFTTEKLSGLYLLEYSFDSGKPEGIHQPQYLHEIDNFAHWLRQQKEVKHVNSHSDILKRLNKNMHGDDPVFYKVPERTDEAAQYLLLYELSLPQGLDLQNRISIDKSQTRMTIILDNISSAELQTLNAKALRWQQDNWQLTQPSKATGTAVMFAYISKRNVESMLIGNVIAIVAIGFIMMLLLRSLPLGLISIVANTLPIIMMFGIWALLVGKVGMVASGVAASTLGIVVDDTVHFLSKYLRARREDGATPLEAIETTFSTVGIAILSTTVILVLGFSILALSDFQLNQQTGLMTALTIVLALIFDLFFLPAILLFPKHQ